LLAPERRKQSLPRTKPGTLLKHQIPIRTFSEWNEHKPGFVEIDLVGHEGEEKLEGITFNPLILQMFARAGQRLKP
jgi:hypothetical protein